MPWQKQFDIDEALAGAQSAFWAEGYERTSLPALLDAMGIQRGSFYATFGSKRETYLATLRRYLEERAALFARHAEGVPAIEALRRHMSMPLDEARGACADHGCFLVNAALERAPTDDDVRELAQHTISKHEGFLASLIERARSEGDAPADLDARAAARALLAMLMGMRVMARASAPRAAIRAVRDQALRLVTDQRS